MLIFIILQGMYPLSLTAQHVSNMRISGIVLDVQGTPLIGVNVVLPASQQGTVTDAEGRYVLFSTTEDHILSFSYIGYIKQDVKIDGQQTINIIMREASQELEDVVIVGYGTQKKVSVTASVSSIEPTTLLAVPTPSLSNTIGGQLPGIITRQESGEPGYEDRKSVV